MYGNLRQSDSRVQRVSPERIEMSSRQTRKVKKPRMLAYALKGDYGDIHHPTLPCKDPHRTPKPEENYISKSMTREKAWGEIKDGIPWRRRKFDFAIIPEDYCEGEGTLRQGQGKNRISLHKPRYLLLSKYGGIPARDVSIELIQQSRRILRYVNALIELRNNVEDMNKENFFHNDITDRNITYDEEKGKAFLIDFEHATHGPRKAASIRQRSNNSNANVDPDNEAMFVDNTIQYFVDSLKDMGINLPFRQEQQSPRSTQSSRTQSSRTQSSRTQSSRTQSSRTQSSRSQSSRSQSSRTKTFKRPHSI
jgi:hypothetical protein